MFQVVSLSSHFHAVSAFGRADQTGKLNRGLSVCDTAEILKGSDLTDDEYFKAAILGWSVELVSCRLQGVC
jgi:hypothetical protein